MHNEQTLRQQRLAREKALYRYATALEQGDIDTIAAILQQATQDKKLETMILEVHDMHTHEDIQLQAAPATELEASPQPIHMAERAVGSHRKGQDWKSWRVLAVAAALVLVLLGAGLVGSSSMFGGSQTAYAFSDVHVQAQQYQGISIKLLKAYTGTGGSYLIYKVQKSPELEKRFPGCSIAEGTLTYQHEIVHTGEFVLGVSPMSEYECMAILKQPFHPATNVQNVTLTWDVTSVNLNVPPNQPVMRYGNWHFTFTIPFTHGNGQPVLHYIVK